ncbi:DUF2779 domain-containing protein [Candidatus Saccharibacteria bacterium]|nr:DUF2779 domain-containing protein [Candidatus Saccharibacteria bacterium]
MAKWLTKSNFNAYLVHPAKLWLAKYDPDKLPPWDEAAEARAIEGREIEAIARERWDDGVLVDGVMFDRPDISAALVSQGIDTIFEAAVLTARKLYAAADAVVKQPDGSWDLYEIKSSTKVRPEHYADVAFQVAAFREAGWQIGRQFVMHVNGDYVLHTQLDKSALITVVDVTDEVAAREELTLRQIDDAVAVLAGPCPALDVTAAGDFYKWLEVMRFMHPKLPEDSVFHLTRLNGDLVARLKADGITKLSAIPLDYPDLKPPQITQLTAVRAGQPVIDAPAIAERLAMLTYPIYYLDYETNATAVPLFEGTKPYQQVPFQYSLHVKDSPTSKLRQCEYLAEGPANPVGGLVDHLRSDLGPTGSVMVWYKPFETSRNTEMGALLPQSADFFAGVNERVFDLMDIFADGLYADPRFHGSASIKNVLPVLVPELSYKTLGIQEGGAASRLWGQAARGELEPEVAAQVYADLRVYCGQDTLAMVRLHEVLLHHNEVA